MQSNNQFPLLEILGLLNSNFALQVDISAEYNYQYDLILIKKQKSLIGYSISSCLNKQLNKNFFYVNLVKFYPNNNSFIKLVALGVPTDNFKQLLDNLKSISLELNFKV